MNPNSVFIMRTKQRFTTAATKTSDSFNIYRWHWFCLLHKKWRGQQLHCFTGGSTYAFVLLRFAYNKQRAECSC